MAAGRDNDLRAVQMAAPPIHEAADAAVHAGADALELHLSGAGEEEVRRVLADDGCLVLLAQRDEGADEGPVNSFGEFLERLGVGPSWDGVPLPKCVDGEWVEVPDKRIYLMARARSLRGYRREFSAAGLRVEHQRVFGRDRDRAAFVLRKEVG